MCFSSDPLLAFDAFDPMFQSAPAHVRELMVARFSLDVTEEGFALGYVFDMMLRGPKPPILNKRAAP